MPCGAETFVFLSHLFENENDQFTKTGSGQTSFEGKQGGERQAAFSHRAIVPADEFVVAARASHDLC
jgi:hypothetical protein